ncbi:beta propeller domain protein [Seminavis robusta]|uniref:Beta propeller domain protein n=1 Tax=Seminavis robusta TaxID=568900 RepID=A0A9N8HPW4_9STRA|nr:beta propeller domain protein [Seminavis robusta]|eukprot:Sro1219_g253400.1 beta propeller domain protein (906) ;mRNA; r:5212-7929
MNPKDNNTNEEETTMENVSLEGTNYDVEKAADESGKGDPQAGSDKNGGTKKRNILLGAVIAFLLMVTIVVAVAVTQTRKGKQVDCDLPDIPASQLQSQSLSASNETAKTGTTGAKTDAPALENPFGDAKLQPFSEGIVDGYASKAEFEADLTDVLKYIAGNVILWNVQNSNQYHYNGINHVEGLNDTTTAAAVAAGTAAAVASAGTDKQVRASNSQKGGTTNNQEKTADEADIVKSDGEFIYAAYGNYLLVMTRGGELIQQVATPKGEPDEYGWTQKEFIRAVLLTEEHVVIVTDVSVDWDSQKGLQNQGATRVIVYTKPTSTNAAMLKVASKIVNGLYEDGLWMQESNSIQILSSSSVAIYDFTDALDVRYFPWMSQADYIQAASGLAETHLIPRFVQAISQGLSVDDQIPSMLRLNAWKPEGFVEPWHFADYFGSFDESLAFYKQITTINANDFLSVEGNEDLQVSTAGAFVPSSSAKLYGTDNALVLSLENSEWNEATQRSQESLFLLNLNIVEGGNQVGATFQSIALLEGRMASKHSLDVQGNDLRVATTLQKWFPVDTVWEACGDEYWNEDPCITEENWDECFDVAIDCPAGKVVKTGCPATFICDINATTTDEDISSTDNFVVVLDVAQQGKMTEIGRVRIGEPHEIITAVRFGETFSYAMTFDERDPFYVLELAPGEAPAIKGSVTLQGFARYLHPLNEDSSMLVGIGQNTTGAGLDQINTGVLISVFDVSDPSEPKVVDSYMLADPDEANSYSVSEYESKAVQYKDGKLIVPASIHPIYAYHDDDFFVVDHNSTVVERSPETQSPNQEAFEGFVVLDVGNAESQGIQELFRVNHHQEFPESCYYCDGSFFEKRSFVYEDYTLVTLNGRVVKGTNITAGDELWSLEPTVEGEVLDCCW